MLAAHSLSDLRKAVVKQVGNWQAGKVAVSLKVKQLRLDLLVCVLLQKDLSQLIVLHVTMVIVLI